LIQLLRLTNLSFIRVKGKKFTLPELLGSADLARRFGDSPSLAIFRLAPQDYHRFHSPVTGTIKSITTLPGDYYTVNPQAVNEPLDVFTANRRDVCMMDAILSNVVPTPSTPVPTHPVAIVAIGALLVGAVGWDHKVGEVVQKGSGLGYFQYGGSTVIAVFPTEAKVQFDEDLIKASEGQWTGTEDAKIMASIPVNAKIGPRNKTDTFGLEVVVKAAERIGVIPSVTETPAAASGTKPTMPK
jgi:phosphatidylserine decarboxylase